MRHKDGAVAAAIAEAKKKLAAANAAHASNPAKFAYMDGESSSSSSYSQAMLSITPASSSDSLSAHIEPPPLPPKLWAKLDTDGNISTHVGSGEQDYRYATIKSTAV